MPHALSGHHHPLPSDARDHDSDHEEAPIRLFVCTGRKCRAKGAEAAFEALSRAVAAKGSAAAHVDVKPCGCLDRCGGAPVAVAFDGPEATAQRPPRAEDGKRALANFWHVDASQAADIVSRLTRK